MNDENIPNTRNGTEKSCPKSISKNHKVNKNKNKLNMFNILINLRKNLIMI